MYRNVTKKVQIPYALDPLSPTVNVLPFVTTKKPTLGHYCELNSDLIQISSIFPQTAFFSALGYHVTSTYRCLFNFFSFSKISKSFFVSCAHDSFKEY